MIRDNNSLLNIFTLTFPDDLEREFREQYTADSLKLIRLSIPFIIILYAMGGWLDITLVPQHSSLFHTLRFAVVIPWLAIVLSLSFVSYFHRYIQSLLLISYVIGGGAISVMIATAPNNIIYYLGLMLVFSAGYFFVNLRFIIATAGGWINVLIFNLLITLYSNLSLMEVFSYNYFFISINFINMFAAYYIEKYNRNNYLLKKELLNESENLEQIIENRTKQLYESEARYHTLVDIANDGIYIINGTHYEYVNQKYQEITGYSYEELTSKDFDYKVLLTPDGIALMNRRYKLYELEKELPKQYELQIISKQGEKKYIEVTTSGLSINSSNSVFGIVRDVTERKKSEMLISEQSKFRQILVEISSKYINMPIDLVDNEIEISLSKIADFIEADRAYIFSYDYFSGFCSNTLEWCRSGIESKVKKIQNSPLANEWIESFNIGSPICYENISEMKDLEGRLLFEKIGIKSFLAFPMMHEGICIGFVGFDSIRDYHVYSYEEKQLLEVFAGLLTSISLRKKNLEEIISAKEKAEMSEKLKSAFLRNISHEIRTPINGILGFSRLLSDSDTDDQERQEFAEVLTQSCKRLINTVNDIVDQSQIDSGIIEIVNTYFLPSDVIREVFENSISGFISKNLELTMRIDNSVKELEIFSDQRYIQQIISTFVSNSFKFTKTGFVELGCYALEKNIVFFVKDTGIGILENEFEKIFERFYQSDLSLVRDYEGSGLGLSIAKGLSDKLGGTITLESKPGFGSTFYFTIPLNKMK